MVKRLLSFWRKDAATPAKVDTWPLCRIRHATLHPGASLWTPGASGGSLGGGASAALDEVGIGGTVAVGFQTTAREQVHTHGVLARVEAREPFPEGTDPMGLGATQRYQLVGLSRIRLDPESCSNRKIPTIAANSAPNRLEDFADAPAPLIEVLQALAALDNAWQPHWAEAFRNLPTQPLGQWATTLGWRLSPEERLANFDQPERIAATLLQTLEALHLGLAPEKRRAAIRAQTLTRRTTVMPHRWMTVACDTIGWSLFHPSDLATRLTSNHAPLGAGTTQQLAAIGAGAGAGSASQNGNGANTVTCPCPGPHRVHVLLSHTGVDLPLPRATVAPAAQAVASPTPSTRPTRRPVLTPADGITVPIHRILVRHGRLFLGPAGLLGAGPGDRVEFLSPEQWVDVPNGLFRVAIWPVPPDQLDGWLRATADVANPPPELLQPGAGESGPVFAAVLEPVELAELTAPEDDEDMQAS
jgi:hypothetical protein